MTVAMASKRTTPPPRAWQRMLSGRRLDLLDPSPMDVEIEDIAHGLARVARWNGQTRGAHAFSVAQHSVVVEAVCTQLDVGLDTRWRLAALLHDSPEYVIGDMISPFKAVLGDGYKSIEKRLAGAIHVRFGLPPELPRPIERLIKRADHVSAWFEAVQLAGFAPDEADRFFGRPDASIVLDLTPEPVETAQTRFIARHAALLAALDAEAV